MTQNNLILITLLLPLFGAAGIWLAREKPNLRESVTLVTAASLFILVAQQALPVFDGARPEIILFETLHGMPIAFRIEPLGMLFALIASGLWIVNSIYSIGYMRANGENNQTRFYICFALSIASAVAVAFSANLLTLFLFYEAMTLITYPLVTHRGTDEVKKHGRNYLGILMFTSVMFFLPALIYVWFLTGTTDFRLGGILPKGLGKAETELLLILFIFGIGKAALMPFHRWLPTAMVAPAPVSALLHAVAVVKAGVFTILKVFLYILGPTALAGLTDWLIGLAAFTIVAASFSAFNSNNLKRRLAYSTISQLAYIVFAAAVLSPLSILGAIMHIATHAFGKITLFFAAGSIYTASHLTRVSQLDGIGRRMPWTMTAFAIGALSMIGLPPAAGFVSKWFMISGAVEQTRWFVLAIILFSTLLNAGYFLPILYRAFFRPLSAEALAHPHGEAPILMVLALCITAAGTLILFFCPGYLLALAQHLVPAS